MRLHSRRDRSRAIRIISPATCLVDLKAKFSKFTYNASLDWKVNPDLLVYIANRKGYRTGGFGTRATDSGGLVAFRPDSVIDYELGAKYSHSFGDGGYFSTNAALYRSNYKDIQRLVPQTVVVNGLTQVETVVANAAKATIEGIEIETVVRPVRWFELSGFMSYTDPKYKSFIIAGPQRAIACATAQCEVANVADFSGVPKWQYGLTGRLSRDLGTTGQFAAQLNWYHQSSYILNDRPIDQPQGHTPGYGVLNGRLEFNNISASGVSVDFYVNNLLKEKYHVADYSLTSEIGFASSLAGPPRMYGVEARFAF